MEIQNGLSSLGLPMVIWIQRRAYVHKNTLANAFKGRTYDQNYKLHFHGVDIIDEEVTLMMAPDENEKDVMKLVLFIPPREAKEENNGVDTFGIYMQDVRGFILEEPPEKVRTWKGVGGWTRNVPRPTVIRLDVGGGELVRVAQLLDHTGTDAPRLRRVLQEMFVDHPVVREWQATFRGGTAAPLPKPDPAPVHPNPSSPWVFGPTFPYGHGKPRGNDDDII